MRSFQISQKTLHPLVLSDLDQFAPYRIVSPSLPYPDTFQYPISRRGTADSPDASSHILFIPLLGSFLSLFIPLAGHHFALAILRGVSYEDIVLLESG
jgi:hypothetical protein